MTALLASVRDADEVALAIEEGADVIDLKDPHRGALGALPLDRIRAIAQCFGGPRTLSATVGDLPMAAPVVRDAVAATADCGVDIVKIGLPRNGDWRSCIEACAPLAFDARAPIRLVGVLFADQGWAPGVLELLAENGFWGAMLDTADKHGGSLRARCNHDRLARFVRACRAFDLRCGLAGSLRLADIEPLLGLTPDYLGFRGALCTGQARNANLDRSALREVRRRIPVAAGSDVPARFPQAG